MPTGKNWIDFLYVNLGFIAQVLFMYFYIALIEIKKNWPKYRCNPLYMIYSENMKEDFTYCVQNTQLNFMGYLLQPLTYLFSRMNSIAAEFLENINGVRNMFSFVRTFITNIVAGIFGVFSNLVIQFQVITIGIKDMIGKIVGVVVTLLYIMDGANKTMLSAWNGPPGQLVQALGSVSCFFPETKIKLKNGNITMIKDVPLGSILENDSKVFAVMQLDNSGEQLYKIRGGVNGEYIYVTGSHFIYDKKTDKFIQVKDYKEASIENTKKTEWYSCLITSNNKITIGDHIFWDWEDDCLNELYK
jgi:hypothetical protein